MLNNNNNNSGFLNNTNTTAMFLQQDLIIIKHKIQTLPSKNSKNFKTICNNKIDKLNKASKLLRKPSSTKNLQMLSMTY